MTVFSAQLGFALYLHLTACSSEPNVTVNEQDELRSFVFADGGSFTSDRASTGGVSFVDYDHDGDADLYVTNGYDVSSDDPEPQRNRFYQNDRGRFVAVDMGPLTSRDGFSSGSTWADYDNDGDLDVFVANQRNQRNFLFRQIRHANGQIAFQDVNDAAPATDEEWSYSAAWGDVDNDGFVDLYVSNGGLSHQGRNFLYRNQGGKAFSETLISATTSEAQGTGGASWGDYDSDGDADLLVASRRSDRNAGRQLALYENRGGFDFAEVGIDLLESDSLAPMSAAWGDIDNDGDLDIYATNLFGLANDLHVNEGGRHFAKLTNNSAVTDPGASYVGAFAELDNDGDLDLVVVNWGAANLIYFNDGEGRFCRASETILPPRIGYGSSVAFADYDSDGDLDIAIGNWPNQRGPGEENFLLRNDYAAGNWLRINLEGVDSNRAGLGARIYVTADTTGQTRTQMREVNSHSGWRSQSELTQHFGLGSAQAISTVKVRWPSGRLEVWTDIKPNRVVVLREGQGKADAVTVQE